MTPTRILRLEGLAALAGALGGFLWLEGSWWLFVVLFLAPDLSMLAYLGGPRVGSLGYNVVHSYVLPLGLAGLAVWRDSTIAAQVAAIWVAHIGADRLAGYGLKYPTGFTDTPLQSQPVPVASLETRD